MDKLKENKVFNILKWVFIFVSALYVIYATVTMRGLSMDGSFYMLEQLNNFANNIYSLSADVQGHPRFAISVLMQFPLWVCNFVHIQNKTVLILVYNFTLFFLPLLVLFWGYKLCQRTKRVDIFFWHLFVYCLCLIIFSIFAVVETLIGAGLHFILWNYLVNDIDYKKQDIAAIIFLVLCMCATYEYVVVLGLIFFAMHFKYDFEGLSVKNHLVKRLIGFGGLFASLFDIYFMFRVPGESGEILRFANEMTNFWQNSLNFCTVFSFLTLILLITFIFKKRDFSFWSISGLTVLYIALMTYLLMNRNASVVPVWEVHTRSIVCWALPLIFSFLTFKEYFPKKEKEINYSNLICIVLLCGIFQSLWQNVNTYYWDKNIQYMKQELSKTKDLLYIPSEHDEISSFWNESLRRYVWHCVYTATNIVFSDIYEQKTLLLHYDTSADEGDMSDRDCLYIPKEQNTLVVPPCLHIDIKNRYWDLTKCAKALDEYNKKNHIKTAEQFEE